MKVLVLAVPIGAGHMKAAQAVSQALTACDEHVDVRFENCFKWVYPLYGTAYKNIYDYAQKRGRRLLKMFYGGVGIESGSSVFLYSSGIVQTGLCFMYSLLAGVFCCSV